MATLEKRSERGAASADATAATRYYDGLTLKQIWCEYRLIAHYELRPKDISNKYYKVNDFTLVYDNRYDRNSDCHVVIWGEGVSFHPKSWWPTGAIFAMTVQRGDCGL